MRPPNPANRIRLLRIIASMLSPSVFTNKCVQIGNRVVGEVVLSPEGDRNETKAKFVLDPGGWSGRLCDYPFWEGGARCILRGLIRRVFTTQYTQSFVFFIAFILLSICYYRKYTCVASLTCVKVLSTGYMVLLLPTVLSPRVNWLVILKLAHLISSSIAS